MFIKNRCKLVSIIDNKLLTIFSFTSSEMKNISSWIFGGYVHSCDRRRIINASTDRRKAQEINLSTNGLDVQ